MNTQKAIECVLWLIQRGRSDSYNMYNIFKMLYEAEKYHLNTYGRPITGDNYMAMEHGTVPSWIYDQTENRSARIGFLRYEKILVAERKPITKFFSKSDIKALEHGYNEYAGLSFNAVRDKNHKEPAWKKNYELRGDSKRAPIPFEDLINEDWLKEELETTSSTMVL
ncbi:MAG: SocA family protein [Fibromonadaceae bacterium]|nr:SocA family protein [Fibromonadaceae bacterium]